ncbi:hypothetical protein BX666DRAFT_2030313 [Dichotomocladium elegans]|nr:hypothetical protein BX666DRAFT_2030313 [Dichotomocladium elegans]
MVTSIQTFLGQKPAPAAFAVEIQPQYCQGPDGNVLAHPGFTFEGSVRFLLSAPMTLRALRLVFRASERVNYDAMGWGKIEKGDGRIFSLRATLVTEDTDLPAGTHVYPFTVEMPLVNYPPTFQHHLVASQIVLIAHMEYCHNRKEDDAPPQVCDSDPYPIHFLPILVTNSASIIPKQPECRVSSSNSDDDPVYNDPRHCVENEHGRLVLPKTRFNVQNTEFIPVQLCILTTTTTSSSSPSPSHRVRLQLKRVLTVIHGSNRRTVSDIMSTRYLDTKSNTNNTPPSSYTRLALPRNCVPSVTYSDRFQIVYQITVSVRTKHGFILTWKKLFEIPITLGTLPEGTTAPADLVKYNDPCIAIEPTGRWKPRFLRGSHQDEGLPAYDCVRPPEYTQRRQ